LVLSEALSGILSHLERRNPMMRTALIATRAIRNEQVVEAEPVVVETDADVVRLELDDGECIDFDRVELLAALRGEET
jgi:sulfur carrier protein ThiS